MLYYTTGGDDRQMDNFFLEKRLAEGNPDLHRRMTGSITVLRTMLEGYTVSFPQMTDHSILHSMDVIEYCNALLGKEQVELLLPEECYVLLMSCYLHDTGMCINPKDYEAFSQEIDFGDYFLTHGQADTSEVIRAFHQEYSGLFIRKYADLFDISEQEFVRAIIQVSRGHRKSDLFDPDEYGDIPFEKGVIRTAFLSAVLRLADELDVSASRNPELLFDRSEIRGKHHDLIFGMHESIREVEVRKDSVIMYCRPKAPEYIPLVWNLSNKIQAALDYCRKVAEERSDLRIFQEQIMICPERTGGADENFSWPSFKP